jgi:hypothetical protein
MKYQPLPTFTGREGFNLGLLLLKKSLPYRGDLEEL